MQYSFPLFFFLLILLTISCSDDNCPEDRDLGYFRFSDTSHSFLQVRKCSTLTFQNNLHDQIQLSKTLEVKASTIDQCIVTGECGGSLFSFTKKNSCDYVSYDQMNIVYSSDTINIRYKLSFDALGDNSFPASDTSSWIESFSINYNSQLGAQANVQLVSDLRGKEYPSREDSLGANRYTIVAEMPLPNMTYYNLYSTRNNTLLFKKKHGIVAFKYQGDLYYLVDCE